MKLVRFGPHGAERPGVLDARGTIRDVSTIVTDWSGKSLDAAVLRLVAQTDLSQLPSIPADCRFGSPIATPGKIICVGLNYADHAAETGYELPSEPTIFFKSPTALSGPFDPIRLPRNAQAADWEVELAVVVGAETRNVDMQTAASCIAGYAVANDITERVWQFDRGGQWSKGKSADTFAPLGPWLVTPDALTTPLDCAMWLRKNQVLRQDSRTSKMNFPVLHIIAHLSEFMTLLPGDVILTGTPSGVAYNKPQPDYLKAGDVIECGIEGLGQQRCEVELA